MNAALDLGGRVAVVTGSGRGLGRAYAIALAAAGATTVIGSSSIAHAIKAIVCRFTIVCFKA